MSTSVNLDVVDRLIDVNPSRAMKLLVLYLRLKEEKV